MSLLSPKIRPDDFSSFVTRHRTNVRARDNSRWHPMYIVYDIAQLFSFVIYINIMIKKYKRKKDELRCRQCPVFFLSFYPVTMPCNLSINQTNIAFFIFLTNVFFVNFKKNPPSFLAYSIFCSNEKSPMKIKNYFLIRICDVKVPNFCFSMSICETTRKVNKNLLNIS